MYSNIAAGDRCSAMLFDGNNFSNNLGCPTSYFVVSVNCRFKEIVAAAVADKPVDWLKTLSPNYSAKKNGMLV